MTNRSLSGEQRAIARPPETEGKALRGLLHLPGAGALSDEARALLLLVAGGPFASGSGIARELRNGPVLDWHALFDLAVLLWVHPILAHVLEHDELRPLVPESLRRPLQLARLAARVRWHAYVRELTPVLEAYQRQAIPVIVLKGAALMQGQYPPGARMINDVDLCVPPECFDQAARLLEVAGFSRYAVYGASASENRRRQSGWVYCKPRGALSDSLVVDLHYRLHPADSPFRQNAAVCARRAIMTSIGTIPVPAFQREDAIVHLACQVGSDGIITLQRLADLSTLLRAGDCDWGAIVKRALAARAGGAAALTLSWASSAGAPVPREIITRLTATSPGSDVATVPLHDLRVLFPGFQLSAASALSLGTWLALPGPGRWRSVLTVPRTVARYQRVAGAPILRATALALRSIPLLFATWMLARLSALAHRHQHWRWVDRINGWLWSRRVPAPNTQSNHRGGIRA